LYITRTIGPDWKHGARCYFLYGLFAKALLRNIPYRYVYFEKISAGMKFRNKKKFRCGIAAYTGPFRALIQTINMALSKPVHSSEIILM